MTISANFVNNFLKFPDSFMGSFADAAGKRVGYKCWLKNRIQDVENCVVQYPISNRGFMDMPRLRISNPKTAIRPVLIFLGLQIMMQIKDIFFEFPLKSLHILTITFIAFEGIPSGKKIPQ